MSSVIQIFIRCRNLKDMDIFSKSDPYVVVYTTNMVNGKYTQIGRTQTKNNNLNPDFITPIKMTYFFEQRQYMKFQVYDDDGKTSDFIGMATTEMSQMMGAFKQILKLDLLDQHKKVSGKLVTICQIEAKSQFDVYFKLKGVKLMNTDSWFDFIDKSDPYLKFMKLKEDGLRIEAKRTQVIQNNLNPSWKALTIPSKKLCLEQDTPFIIQCWDEEQNSPHQFIGQFKITLRELNEKVGKQLDLFNPKSKKPGKLLLQQFKMETKYSFEDYLKSGLRLNIIPCIDFTGSNGSPTYPNSLHYIHPSKQNYYQSAIRQITQVVLNYSTTQNMPCFGFGAIIPGYHKVSHCFPLSLNPNKMSANGIGQLLNMYAFCLSKVNLSGPTYFNQLIKQCMTSAQIMQQQNPFQYQVLLIMTDGTIHDMHLTIDLICNCECLPISIIIVGLGDNDDFKNMRVLDGDSGLINSKGKLCKRDLVQFVAYRDVKNSPDLLRSQVMAELPTQIQQYFKLINIKPHIIQKNETDYAVEKGQRPDFDLKDIFLAPIQNKSFQQGAFNYPQF